MRVADSHHFQHTTFLGPNAAQTQTGGRGDKNDGDDEDSKFLNAFLAANAALN